MSSDLWKEFGGGQEDAVNPWAEALVNRSATPNRFEEDDFGDFQDPVPVSTFETPKRPLSNPTIIEVETQQPPSHVERHVEQEPHVRKQTTSDSLTVPDRSSPFQTPNNPSMARAFGQEGSASSKGSARSRPIPARETSSESTGLVEQVDDEEWADFSTAHDTPTKSLGTKTNKLATKSSPSDSSCKTESKVFERPKYVPPPSVLISQFTILIQTLPNRVETAMQYWKTSGGEIAGLELALRKCISALQVAARIIAGRKSRWIRDTVLAQSMRIGPAQGAKSGGMKLTGVDKVEVQRENSQTAEFVRMWKQRLGAIRVALAQVNNQASDKPLVLPEISETMLVGSSKGSTPVMNDRTNCCLCGLKREERVLKVDVDIWDTSGEWWTSLWGHTDCRVFWEEHGSFLLQG